MKKEEVFKNIVLCIRDWYECEYGTLEDNNLSILKIFKLSFFITCNSPILINYFNYYVMPYGHYDIDLYERVKTNKDFGFFKMGNNSTEFIDVEIDFPISYKLNNEIIKQIKWIQSLNPRFIKTSSFELVNLNQSYYCYQKYYYPSKKLGIFKVQCPNDDILKEMKSLYTPKNIFE